MTVSNKVRGTLVLLYSIEATLFTLAEKSEAVEAQKAFRTAALDVRAVIQEVDQRLQQLEFEEPQYEL